MDNSIVVAPSSSAIVPVQGVIVSTHEQSADVRRHLDIMQMLLDQTTSADTQRTYRAGWEDFFRKSPRLSELWTAKAPEEDPFYFKRQAVYEFCTWPPEDQRLECWQYQARLLREKRKRATVANRSSAIRSLLRAAHQVGIAQSDGKNLFPPLKPVEKYKDTKGIGWERAKQLVRQPDAVITGDDPASKLRRARDRAILRLLVENGIRNSSLRLLKIGDYSMEDKTLNIFSKGKEDTVQIEISSRVVQCIETYVRLAGHGNDLDAPLFASMDRKNKQAKPISANGLRHIVRRYKDLIQLKRLYPHRLRHTALQKLAIDTGGDVIAMQEYSGHVDPKVLMHYAKQAHSRQGKLVNLLSNALED